MRWWSASRLLPALMLVGLAVAPAAAVDPAELMRPCRRQDLIGAWRVMRVNVPRGSSVDRDDPAFLPHQRYVFRANATMTYATQEVPFSPDEQRGLLASFRERVIALMTEAANEGRPLARTQAEQLVWQHLEEHLIHISSSKTEAS